MEEKAKSIMNSFGNLAVPIKFLAWIIAGIAIIAVTWTDNQRHRENSTIHNSDAEMRVIEERIHSVRDDLRKEIQGLRDRVEVLEDDLKDQSDRCDKREGRNIEKFTEIKSKL